VTLTAALNWSGILQTLNRSYRVLLLDQRGHGDGASAGAFRLDDCADDAAAVAGAARHRAAGRGGPTRWAAWFAQLMWRRYPSLVAGLVLCSTARNVSGSAWEQSASLLMPSLVTAAMWMPAAGAMRADLVGSALLDTECNPEQRHWALSEMRSHLTRRCPGSDAGGRRVQLALVGSAR
jgi:pimeloyl-ACP methyl ester carboxylesterase